MKKILALCIVILIIAPIAFFGLRYSKNQSTLVPKPYRFSKLAYQSQEVDAPILIIGDSMAARLEKFKSLLAKKISTNLSKPIKIASLATENEGLHRTFQRIKSLERPPLIIIYLGNIDENAENIFNNSDIVTIEKNLNLFRDPEIRSAIMAIPQISRLVYEPVNSVKLTEEITPIDKEFPDHVLQRRLALSYKLFEATLDEFFNFTTKRSSFLIPITTPLNLLRKPIANCYGSFDPTTKTDLEIIKEKINQKDYKGGYNLSRELALLNPNHALSLFLHGFISFKLNKFSESQSFLEKAIAFDCSKRRGNPVYNNILQKIAKKNSIQYLDFHQYLVDQSQINYTFIDDIYPQDFYMEKLTDMLSLRIKTLLKLN